MTPTEQNVAIAEWHDPNWRNSLSEAELSHLESTGHFPLGANFRNYHSDLNAVHEAEKKLTPEQEVIYADHISSLIMSDAYEAEPRYMKSHLSSRDSTYRCTAPQRCEALLRTIGKWKE